MTELAKHYDHRAAQARCRAEFWVGQAVSAQDRQRLELSLEFAKTRRGWQITKATGWEQASSQLE